MTLKIAGKTVSVADLVVLAGGIVAIVGAPLAWVSVTIPVSKDTTGLDGALLAGKVALALGILIVVVAGIGILKLVKVPQPALIQIALGVLILVVLALVYFTSILSDHSYQWIADAQKAHKGSASLGIGVFLEAIGGLLAIGGGVLALVKKA